MAFKIERNEVYTIQEVFVNLAKLGIDKNTTEKLIKDNKIKLTKVGNKEFITGNDLLKYFEIGDAEAFVH